jgi:chromosome segregation ATPase
VAALETMIRVQRWQLDERRQQLAELERLAEKLRGEARRLVEELAAEQRAATQSTEAGFAYAGYAKAMVDRQARLQDSLAEVDGQIAQARDALAEAFAEMKRYEMAQAGRVRRARASAARRQQILQDELAMQMHRRGKAG